MATTTHTSRTAHLLELMTKGDDAFNARDFEAVDPVHHPDMIAFITGLAEPVYGGEAHAKAMQQFIRSFPDMHVDTPYPIQLGSGDWITVITRATGTFTGEMTLPDANVIAPTGKAFWDSALQAKQLGLT
jgi:ketosteroid isomerase-like protein